MLRDCKPLLFYCTVQLVSVPCSMKVEAQVEHHRELTIKSSILVNCLYQLL